MADNWIAGAVKHPGSFTKQAQSHGQSVQGFASKVTSHPDKFSTKTVRRAALAKTFAKMAK
jgi:hypothetical protein